MSKFLETNTSIPTFVQLCIPKVVTIFLLIFDHNGYITIAKDYFLHKRILIDFLNQNSLYVSELQ